MAIFPKVDMIQATQLHNSNQINLAIIYLSSIM